MNNISKELSKFNEILFICKCGDGMIIPKDEARYNCKNCGKESCTKCKEDHEGFITCQEH